MNKQKRIILAASAFFGIILFGTVAFFYTEPTVHNLFDSFYFTLVTITTVGYGDINPTTMASKLVASVVMIVGIGAGLSFLQTAFDAAFRSDIRQELGLAERRTKMKGHYIICGYGNVGKQIMDQLKARGEKFIIIEKDHSKIEDMVESEIPVIEGDSTHEEVLIRANIKEAKGLLASMPDHVNIMVALTARMLNPDLNIVTEVEDNRNVQKLERAGANQIVHCHEMGARVMVTRARKAVIDPVCGTEVDPNKTKYFYAYDGKEYYFDSVQCLDAFKNSPERFIEMQRVVDASCALRL